MMDAPGLSVVIPVWNLPDDLGHLLSSIRDIAIFDEVIVVDDGSAPSCDPSDFGFDETSLGARLVYLRNDVQRGAGHARNLGLRAVSSEYVLFFDADDKLSPGFADIWATVRAGPGHPDHAPLDFAVFRHSDTRVSGSASFPADERIWNRVLGGADACWLDLTDRAHLSGISAYPWNKIYRTAFLRDNDIRCSESPVHNDVALHWMSFLYARRVYATRALGAEHVVQSQGGHHLTNRGGEDRFCIFEIVEALLGRVRRQPANSALFMAHLLSFSYDLFRWIDGRIDASLRPAFVETARRFLSYEVREHEFASFALWQPEKSRQMVRFLTGRSGL